MVPSTDVKELHSLIEQGIELLHHLETLLTAERQALETRDLDSIKALTVEKSGLLNSIQTNFNTRHELLSNLGVALSEDGWKNYLATLPETVALPLREGWQELADSLERSKQASLVNQQLVLRGQETTERLLTLLQGKNQKSRLYGSSGRQSTFSTQSHIGKA